MLLSPSVKNKNKNIITNVMQDPMLQSTLH
jgi:hypothetical protein